MGRARYVQKECGTSFWIYMREFARNEFQAVSCCNISSYSALRTTNSSSTELNLPCWWKNGIELLIQPVIEGRTGQSTCSRPFRVTSITMLSRLRHSDAALVNAAKDILSNKPYCSPSLSCSKRIERSLIYSGGETAGLFPSLSRYQEAERLSCLLISGSFSIFFLPLSEL